MTRLQWDISGTRYFSAGVDRGVIYPHDAPAEPWDGLISVKSSPLGGESDPIFLDGVKIANQAKPEEFAGSIECFTYPDLVETETFDFCYRVKVGDDISGVDSAYQIHFVYNAILTPSDHSFETISRDINVGSFEFDMATTKVSLPGLAPSAHLWFDSRSANHYFMDDLDKMLYGSDSSNPTLPSAPDLYNYFDQYKVLVVVDHGDGTWSATGPEDVVKLVGTDAWEITWPSAVWLDGESFQLSSL